MTSFFLYLYLVSTLICAVAFTVEWFMTTDSREVFNTPGVLAFITIVPAVNTFYAYVFIHLVYLNVMERMAKNRVQNKKDR